MYYLFKSDNPAWLDHHLGTVCGTVTLVSEDGQQVSVPTAILLATSPLVRSILSDIHPADYGPLVIVLAVWGDVLRVVGKILSYGEANVKDERFEGEVQLFFKMIGVESFLSFKQVEVIQSELISEIEVKDEAFGREISISEMEMLVKVEFVDDCSADVTSNEEKNLVDTSVEKETGKKSSEMEHKCEVCGYVFQNKYNLKKHMKKQDCRETFECDVYLKIPQTLSAFQAHKAHCQKKIVDKCTSLEDTMGHSPKERLSEKTTQQDLVPPVESFVVEGVSSAIFDVVLPETQVVGVKAKAVGDNYMELNKEREVYSPSPSKNVLPCTVVLKKVKINGEVGNLKSQGIVDNMKTKFKIGGKACLNNYLQDRTGKIESRVRDQIRSESEIISKSEEVFVNLKSEPITVMNEECEETKHVERKPGGKKGVSINGCLDKRLLPRDPILGPCKCPICTQQFYVTDFVTEKAYRRHLYSHNLSRFGCQCDKTWQSVKDLKMHIYSVHRGELHCDTCRKTFMTEEDYAAHIASDPHKQEPLMCDDCGFTTSTKNTFYSHIKSHHDKNIQVCELCSKEFNGTYKLKLHKRRFHAKKKPCPKCGEMIKSMWIHMKRMHTKDSDKKYQCDQCGKGFVEQGKYESHKMSVHDKARPFLCRFGCGAATSDKGNRKRHEVNKHGKAFEDS